MTSQGPGPDDRVVPVNPRQLEHYPPEVQLAASEKLKQLVDPVGGDKPLAWTLNTMLCARRLYYAALATAKARLDELGHDAAVEACMAASVAKSAMNVGFTRTELLQQLQGHVLPWLMATVQQDAATEAAEQTAKIREKHAKRLEQKIPLDIVWRHGSEPRSDTDRGELVLVYGPAGNVFRTLEGAERIAGKTRVQETRSTLHVLRLSAENFQLPALKRTYDQRRWPLLKWQHTCVSGQSWVKTLWPALESMNDTVIDLLIIDDITQLVPPSTTTKEVVPSELLKATKVVVSCARELGYAVVAGVPIDEGGYATHANLVQKLGAHFSILDVRGLEPSVPEPTALPVYDPTKELLSNE